MPPTSRHYPSRLFNIHVPYSVRVMTILAGPVVSGLMTRTKRTLPKDSLYQPIEEAFNQRTTHDKHGIQAMPTNEFAQSVITQILKENPPRTYWIGPFTRMVWWIETLGLFWIWHRFFRDRFQLWKLDEQLDFRNLIVT